MLKSLACAVALSALLYSPALSQTAATKSACTATPQCSARTDCPTGSKPMMMDSWETSSARSSSYSFGASQSSSSGSSMSSGKSASSGSSCTCTCQPSMSSGDKSSPQLHTAPVSGDGSKPH